MTVIALLAFLAPEPIASGAARQRFRTVVECRAFLASTAALIESDRRRLELTWGRRVEVVAVCHDIGRGT